MRRFVAVSAAVIAAMASTSLIADEPSAVPKPIPATRPQLKAALQALEERKPRIPLPQSADGQASLDDYLPKTWGRGGGLDFLIDIMDRAARGPTRKDSDGKLSQLVTDLSFWVVSRGNNCQYCLGHQELKLRFGGWDDDTIAALDSDWSQFAPREQSVLAFARKLTLEPQAVGDADVAKLRANFSDPAIVELVFAISIFNSVNRWTDGMGLPQERSDDPRFNLLTPTSEKFRVTTSIVAPNTRAARPTLPTSAEYTAAIAAARRRQTRVALPSDVEAKSALAGTIDDRSSRQWERALSASARAPMVRTWNTVMTDDNLPPRLKAELAFVCAINNRAWYAAAHAAQRLTELGASPAELTSLLAGDARGPAGPAAAHALAAKSTDSPHLVTDADVANVRKHYSDAETAMIMQVICLANMFDRVTEALGLPLEEGIAAKASS